MSVMLETSLGDLVIDLEVDKCPRTCENFLKLCKIKYYALNAFFNVSKDFIAQTGDPTATGTGGESLQSYLHSINQSSGPSPGRYFAPEITNKLKHTARGTVSMAVSPTDPPGCGSQFFITLADKIEYLDGKHAVFGHVIEGFDTLDKINDAFLDKEGRPIQDIRIRHVEILEDPFPDPPNLIAIPPSPIRPPDNLSTVRIADTENPLQEIPEEQAELARRQTAAASAALTLEMIGDIPFAAVRPPENILFVCKLNPVTQDEDLELIFSRFGKILSCEVVRDRKTGDSLQYAFIEFDERSAAEQAYFKMQNVLVDDRRIWVDFSQSVAKMNVSQITSRPRRGRGGGQRGGFSGRGGRDNGYGGRGGGRHEDDDDVHRPRDGYGMVFDDPDRERERDRYRDDRDRERDRERDRDRRRY
ncbi:cyclophilin-like domain-containing protein [Papiliotrema laurentii]|uniref:Peptidyl-prolyl cis-trans isomerase n=1 Tax=Papiliotrema laurentii TaxID=5418 RepID=A0AAD9FJ44_PAPLA|nr:cyclophilin-like domain-containing protein [Papiliotrema laurentii]